MSEYKDYGYKNANFNHVHSYLFKPLLNILDKNINKKILDVGCGNGWLANLLIEKGFDVYGIDASASGIEIANKRNHDRFFIQDVTTDTLPAEIKNIQFDTIISTEVIEHLYSPEKYLEFCRNILQKNGRGELIISTPYHGYLKNAVLALTGNMDKHFTVLWEGGHIKFWSRKTLTDALNKYEFKVTKFIGCGRIPYLWKSMIVKAEI